MRAGAGASREGERELDAAEEEATDVEAADAGSVAAAGAADCKPGGGARGVLETLGGRRGREEASGATGGETRCLLLPRVCRDIARVSAPGVRWRSWWSASSAARKKASGASALGDREEEEMKVISGSLRVSNLATIPCRVVSCRSVLGVIGAPCCARNEKERKRCFPHAGACD